MTTDTPEATAPEGIRWGRVIVGGLLVEVLLTVFAGVFYGLDRMDDLNAYILPVTAVAAALAGAWTGRGTAAPLLNGALAGVAAIVLYVVLIAVVGVIAPDQADFSQALSTTYLASHALKVIGAAVGAWLAGRKAA